MSGIYFIVMTVWTFSGNPTGIISKPFYGTAELCMRQAKADQSTQRQAFPAVGEPVCIAVPEKPKGLPGSQPPRGIES